MTTVNVQAQPTLLHVFEEHVTAGPQWRLLAAPSPVREERGLWDVAEFRLFKDRHCLVELPVKNATASGNFGGKQASNYAVANVLEVGPTFWGGRPNSSGHIWLNIELESAAAVRCARLVQRHEHAANEVLLQRSDERSEWVSVQQYDTRIEPTLITLDIAMPASTPSTSDTCSADSSTRANGGGNARDASRWRVLTRPLELDNGESSMLAWDVVELQFFGGGHCEVGLEARS